MTTHEPQRKLRYAGIVRALVLVVTIVAGSGCFLVPKTKTSRHVIATERVDVPPAASPPLQVELATAGTTITVRAIAPRVCTSENWEIVDTTRSKRVGLFFFEPAGYGAEEALLIVGVILAPVTLTVSGLVTGIVVVSSDDTTTRERRKTATWQHDCPIVGAGLPVAMTLPSGASAELVTGSDGRAYLDLPAGEPEDGVVAVRVSGLAPRELRYCSTHACKAQQVAAVKQASRAACLKERSERMRAAQQVSDIKERQRQLTSLPVCPER
jgi:hypothetical protein